MKPRPPRQVFFIPVTASGGITEGFLTKLDRSRRPLELWAENVDPGSDFDVNPGNRENGWIPLSRWLTARNRPGVHRLRGDNLAALP